MKSLAEMESSVKGLKDKAEEISGNKTKIRIAATINNVCVCVCVSHITYGLGDLQF